MDQSACQRDPCAAGLHLSLVLALAVFMWSPAGRAGEIALSFDDAPWGEGAFLTGLQRTQMLIRKLDSLGIGEVVFFCTSGRVYGPDGRKRLRLYGKAGHRLANHSHSHRHPDDLGAVAYMADVDRAYDSLSRLPGFVKWYRYPFLDEGATRPLRDSVRAALAERGYRNGYVTVDTYDWYLDRLTREAAERGDSIDVGRLKAVYVKTLWDAILFYDTIAQDVLRRSPKHILLLHENDLAALFIDTLVTHIRANGWRVISPTEAYSDPIADSIPDVLMNNQGRVAAIAIEQGYTAQDLASPFADTRYLDSLFVKEVLSSK